MNAKDFAIYLDAHNPCSTALNWIEEQPRQTLIALWRTCPNATWMIWLLETIDEESRAKPTLIMAINRAIQYTAKKLKAAKLDCYKSLQDFTLEDYNESFQELYNIVERINTNNELQTSEKRKKAINLTYNLEWISQGPFYFRSSFNDAYYEDTLYEINSIYYTKQENKKEHKKQVQDLRRTVKVPELS